MLNNLTNFLNIITGKMIKKVPEATDLITLGTRDSRYGGSYKPTAITVEDFIDSIPVTGVQSVVAGTNVTVNNVDPLNPIVNSLPDGVQSVVAGTNVTIDDTDPANPIVNATGGGGGLQGIQVPFNNLQGGSTFGFNATINSGNTGNTATSASRLDVYPFTSNHTLTNCSLTIGVATLGVGVLARIVIYSNVNSFPATKLYESTDIDCSTTGDKVVLANFTFTAGTTYWLGFYANGATTVRAIANASLLPLFLSNTGGAPIVAWSRIGTTLGTAPNTFNYNTYSQALQVSIFIRPT